MLSATRESRPGRPLNRLQVSAFTAMFATVFAGGMVGGIRGNNQANAERDPKPASAQLYLPEFERHAHNPIQDEAVLLGEAITNEIEIAQTTGHAKSNNLVVLPATKRRTITMEAVSADGQRLGPGKLALASIVSITSSKETYSKKTRSLEARGETIRISVRPDENGQLQTVAEVTSFAAGTSHTISTAGYERNYMTGPLLDSGDLQPALDLVVNPSLAIQEAQTGVADMLAGVQEAMPGLALIS